MPGPGPRRDPQRPAPGTGPAAGHAAPASAGCAAPASALPADPPVAPARERLVRAGLQLFAERGYRRTSTRALAEAAGVNIASISYYFGDKAGLYRAVFSEPQVAAPGPAEVLAEGLPLRAALRRFYAAFLEPLREGELARLCLKLHFREMLEPTGLWPDAVPGEDIRPLHQASLSLLQRHLGVAEPDPALLRLAVCLQALGVHQHVGREMTDALAPGLYDGPEAIDQWAECLADQALAMIEAERIRRAQR